ncbi:MAG: glucosamine-6-phosphate deaminase [Actinobacteria bacterium]|nr:glucosamine-6-phosphate deaminase [Actinomycetota bacterium]
MSFLLEVLPHRDWADSIADLWAERLSDSPGLTMCLATGSTPKPVYRAIAGHADLSGTKVFLLDEFGLEPGDPARCDVMLGDMLLSRLEVPPALEKLNPQAANLDAECDRYSQAIARDGLSLVILGLGTNGHLGLNEPGSGYDSTTRVVALADETMAGLSSYGTTSTTSWGMTIGLAEILSSDEAWLLVSGEHKAQILRQTLIGPVDPSVPASFLRMHSNVIVWVDEAASSQLV